MPENEMTLPGRDPIEAYVTQDGYICLKQDYAMGNEQSIVMMLPHDIPQIVEWLQRLANELPLPPTQA